MYSLLLLFNTTIAGENITEHYVTNTVYIAFVFDLTYMALCYVMTISQLGGATAVSPNNYLLLINQDL